MSNSRAKNVWKYVLTAMLAHFIRKKGILRFGKINLSGGLVRDIIVHGLPEGVSQLSTPITSLCMNLVFVNMIGDIAVNAD